MFNKIKKYFSSNEKEITTSEINQAFLTPDNDNYRPNRGCIDITDKLNGYQYIAADIVAKTVASQTLRLYASKPSRGSKYHKGREKIIVKNVPVDDYRRDYFNGLHEKTHNNIMDKSLSTDEGIVQILQHQALDVLRNINPYSNQWEFLYTLTLGAQYYGNSYFEKTRLTNGQLAELWYSPPQYMKIIQGKTTDDFINHYEWGECIGAKRDIAKEDMLDFKIPGIGSSQVYGTSKIEVVWKYINLINSSLSFQKSIMDNTGRADMILIAESASASQEDSLKRFESAYNDKHFGIKNAGKASIFPGKLRVEVIPRADFDFDNDTSLVRAIARGFGLPEYKVLPSSAIKANDSTQEK